MKKTRSKTVTPLTIEEAKRATAHAVSNREERVKRYGEPLIVFLNKKILEEAGRGRNNLFLSLSTAYKVPRPDGVESVDIREYLLEGYKDYSPKLAGVTYPKNNPPPVPYDLSLEW